MHRNLTTPLKTAAIALVLFASVPAKAVTITVETWLAANAAGSPSFAAAEANAVQGMMNGGVATGSGPSAFTPITNVTPAQAIVTQFRSWMGVVDPASAFGAAYANESGNRMTFAVSAIGDPSHEFSISQMSFAGRSSDPSGLLNFDVPFGGYNYSAGYVGVRFGADGKLGGGDDIFITSGPNTQLVDALFGRGSGNSLAAVCHGCTLGDVHGRRRLCQRHVQHRWRTRAFNLDNDGAGFCRSGLHRASSKVKAGADGRLIRRHFPVRRYRSRRRGLYRLCFVECNGGVAGPRHERSRKARARPRSEMLIRLAS